MSITPATDEVQPCKKHGLFTCSACFPDTDEQWADNLVNKLITRETHKGSVNRIRIQAKTAIRKRLLEIQLQQLADDRWAINHGTIPEVKYLMSNRKRDLQAQLKELEGK